MLRAGAKLGDSPVLQRLLMSFLLIWILAPALHCDSDETVSTSWSGTYTPSDGSADGSGTLSFEVTASDTIYCFVFTGSASVYSTSCQNPASGSFPINGLQFSIPVTTSQGAFTLKGQFASSTQASGEIVGSDDSTDVVLTWAAHETSVANQ